MSFQPGTLLKNFISENKKLFTLKRVQILFDNYADFISESDEHAENDDLLSLLLTVYNLSDILSRMERIPKEMFLWYRGPIVIPENIKVIEEEAFYDSDITSLILPESLKEINNLSFCGCNQLNDVEFGYNLKRIGQQAFCDCRRLDEIKIPKSVSTIGFGAFYGCNLSKVTIPWGFKGWLENIFEEKTIKNTEFNFI